MDDRAQALKGSATQRAPYSAKQAVSQTQINAVRALLPDSNAFVRPLSVSSKHHGKRTKNTSQLRETDTKKPLDRAWNRSCDTPGPFTFQASGCRRFGGKSPNVQHVTPRTFVGRFALSPRLFARCAETRDRAGSVSCQLQCYATWACHGARNERQRTTLPPALDAQGQCWTYVGPCCRISRGGWRADAQTTQLPHQPWWQQRREPLYPQALVGDKGLSALSTQTPTNCSD